MMLKKEAEDYSHSQLPGQLHDDVLDQQDGNVVIREYEMVTNKPFKFFKNSSLPLQVSSEESTLHDLKPSQIRYDCLDISVTIPSNSSSQPKSLSMEIFEKHKEQWGLILEDFKKDNSSLDLHRILAKECHGNWLSQQLP